MNSISQNSTDIALNRNFQFIEAIDSQVYIDSRVYCAEIIQVHHGDWIRDTLRKHQEAIELKFGTLRFETGTVLTSNGVANNTQIFYLLTEDQCNACLVLSKNQTKTISAKLELVADFSRAKQLLKTQFERQFAAVTIPDSVENFPRLAGLAQTEICRLAEEYLRVRDVAAETMPTLIEILDALAIPGAVPAATNWFTARSWLASNGYIFSQLKQRQFFQAIANTHRFLTATPPQKHNGINYYSNQHDILLKACAANVLKLGFKRTATFI